MVLLDCEVVGVRISKPESKYVQIFCQLLGKDQAYLSEGFRFDQSLVTIEDFNSHRSQYKVGSKLKCCYSANEKNGVKKYYFNLIV